jgi:hypothetical protein
LPSLYTGTTITFPQVQQLSNFISSEGVFFGANGYESGNGYNQNQGWVLWAIVDHVRLSGDWEWLRQNANAVIKGCQWIITERTQFMAQLDQRQKNEWHEIAPNLKPIYYGFLPPGGVEDIDQVCQPTPK